MLDQLAGILKKKRFKHILLYYPLASEFDIRAILCNLKKQKNIHLYIPRLDGSEFDLLEYRFPLHKGRFSLHEPSGRKKDIRRLDAMVVPILGWDKEMRRVGFGKGFYDRFYSKLSNKPYIIFISLLGVYIDENITQHFDIGADLVLTPYYQARRKYNGMDIDKPYNLDYLYPSDFFCNL